MSLWEWYVSRGRINRSTWWLRYALPIVLLSLLATMADVAFGTTTLPDLAAADPDAVTAVTTGPFATLVAALTFVPSISSNVTRLHDRGLSAWWLLLALIPVFGVIALLVIIGFLRGEAAPNRYGPPQLPPHAAAGEPLYPPPHWT
ncbi:MAG: conserved rane protein of unknown function [Modestobacter sp.]|jgi:uncharacterized membrane protein YhaH (DUF805 family)|nr:conserved rane protein of unknown function [Modestobacter sp.]